MAQEAILNVSLKDYKKNIDELRGSLLGLEKDSEDYKKIAEELKDKQDKLNEVMSVGKEAVNAVDGSYNQLSATLSRLKKEWKNMEIGTPEWEAMAVRINDINNQLKDADAQVGVFTRNVGDYANAFEEAFKQAAGGLAKIPGPIGEIASTIKQLIPLIKQTTNTAVAGLTGVSKALKSTGIGALIVAVGLLIAHFDDLRKMFKKDNPVEEADKRFKELETSIDKSNAEIEREIELMEAAGVSTQEIIDKKIELLRVQKSLVVAEGLYIKSQIGEIEKHGKIRRWITGENKDLEELIEKYKELYQQDQKYIELIADAENSKEADKIRKRKAAADEEKKQLDEILKRVKENSKSEIQALTDKYNEELALLKKYGKDATELTKQYNDNIEKINKQALEKVYNEMGEFNPFDPVHYQYDKMFETMQKFQSVVDGKFPPEALLETEDITKEMIDKAREAQLVIGNTPEEFAEAWALAYQKFKKVGKEMAQNLAPFSNTWVEDQEFLKAEGRMEEYLERQANGAQQRLQQLSEQAKDLTERLLYLDSVTYQTLNDIDDSNLEKAATKWAGIVGYESEYFANAKEEREYLLGYYDEIGRVLDEYSRDWENASLALDNYRHGLEEVANQTDILEKEFGKDSNWQWFSNTSRFYEIYDARLKAAEWYRDNLEIIEGETNEERKKRELEAEQAILQIKREYAKKHIEISQSLGNGLTSIWGSINDIYEANAKAQGKTDEEIFNQTKGSKIAVATIDTIQGSLAAFMGWQEYPQPYAAIMGGIQAAATLAAGMAQIAQIRATQFNSAGQNISSPQAVVNATPRMVDYAPDLVSNVTGASEIDSLKNALQETQIFVSVSDINEAQAKVTDRNKESSF